jgi:hypothetical protein
MYDRESPNVRLAEAVDGASMVMYHATSHRLFVWRHGIWLDVVSVNTGEVLGNWPCDGDAASAATVVAERTNAGY